jgi:hypothetical protein
MIAAEIYAIAVGQGGCRFSIDAKRGIAANADPYAMTFKISLKKLSSELDRCEVRLLIGKYRLAQVSMA